MVSNSNVPPGGQTSEPFGRTASNAPSGEKSFEDVSRYLKQARQNLSLYMAVQSDRIKAFARSAVLLAVAGLAGLIIVLTIVVMATVLLCSGIAGGLGELLGGRQWAGDIITGGLVLGAIVITGFVALKRISATAKAKTFESYRSPAGRRN